MTKDLATAADARLSSPAAFRNRVAILDVLRTVLPARGIVLEVASGSGQHVTYFAKRLPALEWQPSDISPEACASITAWSSAERLDNVRVPLRLDTGERPWPLAAADAVIAINLIHISPWPVTEALLAEAGRLLPPGSPLYLYGPFVQSGVTLAPGNAAFDADLRHRNSAWGLRDIGAIEAEATRAGLQLDRVIPMPADNLSLILRRL